MSNKETKNATALTTVRKDVVDLNGFSDFTNESEGGSDDVNTAPGVIQGTRIKFIDPRWLIDGQDVTGMLLTIIGVRNVVTEWGQNNKPITTNILPPGQKFPDFKKLNEKEPQSKWRMAFGQLRGPWEGQHCLYMIDDNYNRYTWASPITTIGSAIAVDEIVRHINTVRKFRGPDAFVVAELSHTHFPNRYKADRERPFFVGKRVVTLNFDRAGDLPAADTPLPMLSDDPVASSRQQGAPADAQTVEPI